MGALKFYVKIGEEGKIELPEFREFRGRREEIVILPPKEEDIEDLLMASESGLDFWDNPIDDEVWNEVQVKAKRDGFNKISVQMLEVHSKKEDKHDI